MRVAGAVAPRGVGLSNWKLAGAAILMGCVTQSQAAPPPAGHRPQLRQPQPEVFSTATETAAVAAARAVLEARLQSLGRSFNGHVGIAVRDVQTGWTTAWNGNDFMPQQSVSKFWVALTALDKVDHGELNLDAPVIVTKSDLTLFHQPIAASIGSDGYRTTLRELMARALQQSDNTCNDFVLRRAGGPEAVRSFVRRNGIDGVRFGPGEKLLQSQTAGLSWRPEYSIGHAFEAARSQLPMSVRRAALERYLANPIDGATALGLTSGLMKLKRGELLSPASSQFLLNTMSHTKTGPNRLKGGLQPGWTLAHKTGTGQDLGGTVAGYNDVGVLTAPDGHSYAIAVLIGRTTQPIPARMKLMNEAVRAVIDFEQMYEGA